MSLCWFLSGEFRSIFHSIANVFPHTHTETHKLTSRRTHRLGIRLSAWTIELHFDTHIINCISISLHNGRSEFISVIPETGRIKHFITKKKRWKKRKKLMAKILFYDVDEWKSAGRELNHSTTIDIKLDQSCFFYVLGNIPTFCDFRALDKPLCVIQFAKS